MRIKVVMLSIGLFLGPIFTSAQSTDLQTKIGQVVNVFYKTYDYQLIPIKFTASSLPKNLPRDLTNDKLFRLKIDGSFKAYAYWGQGSSKDHAFDFLILFNTDLQIEAVKILVYREQFGREITNQRWLKQFVGMTPQSVITYGSTIDGISGATISSKSMTYSVKQVLRGLQILQHNGLL